ncbi:TatD family nuclease-associated radical SAM protein [Caldicellulosiruptoraceae bacterium PP1]
MSMITYTIENRLYINVTNKCSNDCTFCIRATEKGLGEEYDLWLKHEPSVDEILSEIKEPNKYDEIVFCGYGEPLLRYDVVIEVSKRLKEISNVKLRINTNGQASFIFKTNIPKLLSPYIDVISISLNAPNKERYNELCRPFDEDIYDGVIEFIKDSKKYIKEVWVSVLDILDEKEIKECQRIADELGVNFRIRRYEG